VGVAEKEINGRPLEELAELARKLPVAMLRKREVVRLSGLSATSIWRLVRRGDFPKPLQLAPNAIGWRAGEVMAWLASRSIAALPPVGRGRRENSSHAEGGEGMARVARAVENP